LLECLCHFLFHKFLRNEQSGQAKQHIAASEKTINLAQALQDLPGIFRTNTKVFIDKTRDIDGI
jgi:hypothetical protein